MHIFTTHIHFSDEKSALLTVFVEWSYALYWQYGCIIQEMIQEKILALTQFNCVFKVQMTQKTGFMRHKWNLNPKAISNNSIISYYKIYITAYVCIKKAGVMSQTVALSERISGKISVNNGWFHVGSRKMYS